MGSRSSIRRPDGLRVSSYRELASGEKIPTGTRRSYRTPRSFHSDSQLYPVTITDKRQDQVKVHYTGWSHKHDTWLPEAAVVNLITSDFESNVPHVEQLKIKLKETLIVSSRRDSSVKFSLPLSREHDVDELMAVGTIYKHKTSYTVYRIRRRQDLEKILGHGWDYRVVNPHGDNFYVKTESVQFYVRKRKPLKDFVLYPDHTQESYIERGYSLVFKFVKMAGNKSLFDLLLNSDVL